MSLRVAHRVPRTTAEGPGVRYALWVQGCSIRCAGCCNPGMFPVEGGETFEVAALLAEVVAADVEGLTLLGGEPFEQAEACAELARAVRATGRSVMVFTGYRREDLEQRPSGRALLAATDVLVDGPYDRAQPERTRRWIGSANQRVHQLTDRYAHDPAWQLGDEVVITLRRGLLEVHGWPGAPLLEGRR